MMNNLDMTVKPYEHVCAFQHAPKALDRSLQTLSCSVVNYCNREVEVSEETENSAVTRERARRAVCDNYEKVINLKPS